MLTFNKGESPGVKVSPFVSVAMAGAFIGTVVFLHIVGKIFS